MEANVLMIVMMLVVFYFFMMRPQMKKQKELKKFREAMKPGDKIVTIGGLHGKVLEVSESTVLISSEGTKLRFDKTAVALGVEDRITAQ